MIYEPIVLTDDPFFLYFDLPVISTPDVQLSEILAAVSKWRVVYSFRNGVDFFNTTVVQFPGPFIEYSLSISLHLINKIVQASSISWKGSRTFPEKALV